MPVHSLALSDFSSNDYTLIGIHTVLEDYRLAYLLNRDLNVHFFKISKGLSFGNDAGHFALYEFFNKESDSVWHLIANVFKSKKELIKYGIFTISDSNQYLIKERKKIDFFIKLEGNFEKPFIEKIVNKINKINKIIMAYTIEVETLKSKEFLII